ncbi:unnamed protein product [Calicophoron daubneyi]|uniref:FAR1 domain-containing protein n=1 Tax=Calicophoron daubneyi TaxID=300641 RepID=A0AAV2U2U2_CALDB
MQSQVYDVTAAFEQHFITVDDNGAKRSRMFTTWENVEAEIHAFSLETYTIWSVRDSKIVKGTYEWRRYQCRFAGFAIKPRAPVRASSTCSTNCGAQFTIARRRRGVRGGEPVFIVRVKYNMQHNHPLNGLDYALDPTQRRLSEDEEREISYLIFDSAAPEVVISYVLKHFGKVITSHDLANIRSRLRRKLENRALM